MNRPLLGAVLAGGRSRRFGSDKALAVLDGTRLIDRVIAGLRPQVDALVICGRAWPPLGSLPDQPAPGLGPLGGLCAALLHARDRGFAAVLAVPCDLPGLPASLAAALDGEAPAYIADCPVIGRWPATLAPMLATHLARSADRSMRSWARLAGARAVTLSIPLPNINTPADLVRITSSGAKTAPPQPL